MLNNPMHPGEVLKELYLDPLNISPIALARKLRLPRTRIERVVRGDTSVSSDTALRLARFFETTPQYWLNMQANYDLANIQIDLLEIEPLERAYA